MSDDYAPLPQPNFEVHDTRPFDDPHADVRLALHQCSSGDGETREAFTKLASMARDENMKPHELAASMDKLDEASWKNPNVAVGLVDAYHQEPYYVPKDEPVENDPWRQAVKDAIKGAVSPDEFKKSAPYLNNLAHRNGSAADYINNAFHLREMARVGGQDYQLARQTAYSHYNRGFDRMHPHEAHAIRDHAQLVRIHPDIRSDHALREAISTEMKEGDFPLEFDQLQIAHEARRRVLERRYNG